MPIKPLLLRWFNNLIVLTAVKKLGNLNIESGTWGFYFLILVFNMESLTNRQKNKADTLF